ncbi:MAG TPA: hypothetical protein VIA80_12695, partial [Hyphomonadaceae bacterium]
MANGSGLFFLHAGNPVRFGRLSAVCEKGIASDFRALPQNSCRRTDEFSSPLSGGLTFSRMNRAQSVANWSGVPSLSHPWMAALLRLAAMLVSNAVRPLRMLLTLLPRECHTDVERDRLPARKSGNHQKEVRTASRHSANVLLPRTGEALRAQTGQRSGPGGGPPHRLITARPVPHRIVLASLSVGA